MKYILRPIFVLLHIILSDTFYFILGLICSIIGTLWFFKIINLIPAFFNFDGSYFEPEFKNYVYKTRKDYFLNIKTYR